MIKLIDCLIQFQKSEERNSELRSEVQRLRRVLNNEKNFSRKLNAKLNGLEQENAHIKKNLASQSCVENEIVIDCDSEGKADSCSAKNFRVLRESSRLQRSVGVDSPSDISTLNIVNQDMFYFPIEIKKIFPNLQSIVVENSKLSKIPLFEDMDLSTLEVRGNKIASIDPNAFLHSSSLVILDLSNNEISNLPAKLFEKLINLREIDLSHNMLSTLSFDSIPKWNSIESFKINNNRLMLIDPRISNRFSKMANVDFQSNECIDMKIDGNDEEGKRLALFGKISMNCTNDSQLCQ
jgi:Leucine-rich repeat (LRR) protein